MFKNSSSFSELAYFSALTALYITHSTRDPSDSLTLYFLHSDLFYSIEHNTASGELRVGENRTSNVPVLLFELTNKKLLGQNKNLFISRGEETKLKVEKKNIKTSS